MTTIMPEAFDRFNLIKAIKDAQSSLQNLLKDAEHGDLKLGTLQETKKHLKRLMQEVDQKINLKGTVGRL